MMWFTGNAESVGVGLARHRELTDEQIEMVTELARRQSSTHCYRGDPGSGKTHAPWPSAWPRAAIPVVGTGDAEASAELESSA